MQSLFKKAPQTNFGSLLKFLSEDGITLSLVGLFNVESGHLSVRTERFNEATQDYTAAFRECDKCSPQEEGRLFFSNCDACGKKEDNYFWIPSGDGDGVYAAFELLNKNPESGEVETRGFATVLFPTESFAEPIVEKALEEAANQPLSPLYAFGFPAEILDPHNELEAFEVTKLECEQDGKAFFISDVSTTIDSDNAIIALHLDNCQEITILAFSEEPESMQLGPKPRIVIGYSSSWLGEKGFSASMERPSSRRVFDDWVLTGIQSCHIETMGDVATWFNFKMNEAMEKYNYAASWLLQGALHGDSDCIEELDRYSEHTSDPEWIATWLGQRKQYQAAIDFEDGRLTFPFGKSAARTSIANESARNSEMFCSKCGTKSGGGNFCIECGAKLVSSGSITTVMCSSCGIKISNDESKPCPGCGHTSQNTKPVTASSVTKTANDLASSDSTLKNLMYLLGNATFALRGVVNVESGDISFRAQKNDLVDLFDPLNSCDDCGPTEEGIPFFVSCKTCSRSPENYFWIKSGNGDGIYTVIEISELDQSDEKVVLGVVVVLVRTQDFTQPIVDEVLELENPYLPHNTFDSFKDLKAFEVTSIKLPKDQPLLITDKHTELNSDNATVRIHFSDSTATTLRFFSFSEFTINPRNKSLDAETEVIMKTLNEMSEATKNIGIPELSVTPRVVIGLNAEWLEKNQFNPSIVRPDESDLFYDWEFFGIGDCHIETEGGTAAWFNAMLFRHCWDKLTGMVVPWLLQGAAGGDKDCQKALQNPAYSDILSDKKLLAICLRMNAREELAAELENSGKIPAFLKKPNSK